jgi:hypothetical protein
MDGGATDHTVEHPRVRLFLPIETAEQLETQLVLTARTPEIQRLLDQLWLRTALIEQWRRMRLSERPDFIERADRVLAALDL